MLRKTISIIIVGIIVFATVLSGCGKKDKKQDIRRNLTDNEFTYTSLTSTDKFGTEMNEVAYRKSDSERYVGLFYWMWISNTNYYYHGIYDCTKLMSTEEGQAAFWNIDTDNTAYENLSKTGAFHFTNEPLYGYYNSSDPWVITRHMEMFIDAGIDFIFLDTSNALIYEKNCTDENIFDGTVKSPCYTLLDTMLDLYNKGWDVPKVVFLTNTGSGTRVSEIREKYYEYENGKYDDLWFYPEGKPMIIGTTEDNNGASGTYYDILFDPVSEDNLNYFDVKETQWPGQPSNPNGFPWIWKTYPNHYHEKSKAISVSVAQHGNFGFTDMLPRSNRGYDAELDVIEENWQQGKNFENQWQTVYDLEKNGNQVKYVNVTGWNEWIGAKFGTQYNSTGKAAMIDNFYGPYTRDIEMDKTLYQDTTALQLARNIRKYKYTNLEKTYKWPTKTIKTISDFDKNAVNYTDVKGDAISRDFWSFDVRRNQLYYTDNSNRNDIVSTKVIHDDNNVYFLIETAEDITENPQDGNWMNILIKTATSNENNSFAGYNYILNRTANGGVCSVDVSNGGWNWTNNGNAKYSVVGNKMMVTVPLNALGLTKDNVKFEFKVADNVVKPSWFNESDAEHDILYYYVTGDSAPLGRFSYSYGY